MQTILRVIPWKINCLCTLDILCSTDTAIFELRNGEMIAGMGENDRTVPYSNVWRTPLRVEHYRCSKRRQADQDLGLGEMVMADACYIAVLC
jgi:hypothetical protein